MGCFLTLSVSRILLSTCHKSSTFFSLTDIAISYWYSTLIYGLFIIGSFYINRHSGSVVERPLCDREVAGSIPGRVIPKTLKMVLAALSLGAQH